MRTRIAFLLVIPVWIALAIWLSATGECGAGASCVATARVNDLRYSIAVARGMTISDADLAPYAVASKVNSGVRALDAQTYRLGKVDPTKVLIMKIAPGQAPDDVAPGRYLLLINWDDSTAFLLTCPWFTVTDASRPVECTETGPPAS